jgi:hypothetical protein
MRSGRAMKGQLVLEFVVAAILLFGVITYVMGNVMTSAGSFNVQSAESTRTATAFAISDLILREGGTWTGGEPLVVGVSDDWPVLNSTKLQDLEDYCGSDYEGLKYRLGLGPRNGMAILVNETGVGEIMQCSSPETEVSHSKVTRFGLTEAGNIAKIEIWVW